jgi:hypothetical protein
MQDVVLDTCCLLNLCAAGKLLSAAASMSLPPSRRKITPLGDSGKPKKPKKPALDLNLHVPAKVKEEARYLLKPDEEDKTQLVKADLDLAPYFQAGRLLPCDFESEKETELFVQLAVKLDDGEAVCFAIAMNRGWILASDDRPTERLAKQLGLTLVTTPELVKRWAENSKATEQEVAEVIHDVQTFAHYFPRKGLPLHSWWMEMVQKVKR